MASGSVVSDCRSIVRDLWEAEELKINSSYSSSLKATTEKLCSERCETFELSRSTLKKYLNFREVLSNFREVLSRSTLQFPIHGGVYYLCYNLSAPSCYSSIAVFNECYSELTPYTALANSCGVCVYIRRVPIQCHAH